MCLALTKRPDLSTERLSSSQRQQKACSVVISHLFVFALVPVPCDEVTGSESRENAQFI